MSNELTCSQVMALLSFYLEDKLSPKLRQFVDNHLKYCTSCSRVYNESRGVYIADSDYQHDDSVYQTRQYDEFKDNLSAYIDNELDYDESLRMKKIAISNPLAKKDLQDIYTFKKMLKDSFEKTRNEFKVDFSKDIVNKLFNMDNIEVNKFPLKLVGAFTAIMCAAVAGFLIMLNS